MAENHILLETIELTQTASSVTFDNLPTSGYSDLKILHSIRVSSTANVVDDIAITFNGTSTASFAMRRLFGSGTGSLQSDTGGSPYNFVAQAPNSSATANIYGNGEIYIPNYRSSNFKSFSQDAVSENNGTASYVYMAGSLWSNTNPITSITLSGLASNLLAGSTFSLYGVADFAATPVTAPFATGGNIVANDGTYWYHAFLSSGTFTPFKALSCDVLLVAGGGGGAGYGGGGGAGGVLAHTAQSVLATAQTVTVGAGGVFTAYNQVNTGNGNNSQFASLSAAIAGGGGGSATTNRAGNAGGSGGGSGGHNSGQPTVAGGAGTVGPPRQGFDGGEGIGTGNAWGAGGGGGAGAVGVGTTGKGGVGTTTYSSWGIATTTGVNSGGTVYYAGGGSGHGSVTNQTGGIGGGGSGGYSGGETAGTANTGGGGGSGNGSAANGGSGIVIVRYPMV